MANLLLVDDDRSQCLLFREELEEDGHHVEVLHDGKSAVEYVSSKRPHLVVLDINMPVMDGLDALGKILERDPRVPVVIHTAYTSYRDSYISLAAEEYVVKNPEQSGLREAVARVLKKRYGDDLPDA